MPSPPRCLFCQRARQGIRAIGCCQYRLQRLAIQLVARKSREGRHEVDRTPSGDTVGDQLPHRRDGVTELDFHAGLAGPEHERDLALRRLGETRSKLLGAPDDDFFESLRQLTADGDTTVGQSAREAGQARRQTLRRLEGHCRVRPVSKLGPECAACVLGPRQETHELVPLACEAARHESGGHCRRAGKHRDADPGLEGRRDEPRAGVVDGGEAGVRDEGDTCACTEPLQHLAGPPRLVVPGVADQLAGSDAVPVEQHARVPRVLAEHDLSLGKLAQDTERDVLEIADRRRADGERHYRSNASNAIRPAPTRPASAPSSAGTIRTSSRPGLSASRATTSRAGAKRGSPAFPKPPPSTISSGLKTLTRLAMPAPRIRPSPSRASLARASPSDARRTRSCPVASGPSTERATASAAVPETSASKWPRPGQSPTHVGPSYLSTMWPSSAPAPTEPRYGFPSRISPPPIPVPSVSMIMSRVPAPAPSCHSAIAAAFPSLSIATGRPKRSSIRARKSSSASGMCTELTARPDR